MKEHEVRQRIEKILKVPTVAASILLAGLVGMACSGSGLKRKAGDAGAASGVQAGSSSGDTGGTGGTIGLGGAGGPSTGGAGGGIGPGGAGGSAASGYGGICSGTWSEPPDASADGMDGGRIPCCGDGHVDEQYGEMCDLGNLNGLSLDASGNPTDAAGCPACTTNCSVPLCVF